MADLLETVEFSADWIKLFGAVRYVEVISCHSKAFDCEGAGSMYQRPAPGRAGQRSG
jgi:hypothetical protein